MEGREIPIVHRVLSLHTNHQGDSMLLTKGDNNSVDDRGLYASKPSTVLTCTRLFPLQNSRCQLIGKGSAKKQGPGPDRFVLCFACSDKELWLKDTSVMGTTVVYLPYVGQVTIILNDYPIVKWSVISGMVILALLGYE